MDYFDLNSLVYWNSVRQGVYTSYHARFKCSLVRTTYNKNDIHNTQTIPIHTYFHENQTTGNGISKSQTKTSRYMPFMKTNRKLLEKRKKTIDITFKVRRTEPILQPDLAKHSESVCGFRSD